MVVRAAAERIAPFVALVIAGCTGLVPSDPPPADKPSPPPVAAPPAVEPPPPVSPKPSPPSAVPPAPAAAPFAFVPGTVRPAAWSNLPGWGADDPSRAWEAFLASCRVLQVREHWRPVCEHARALRNPDREAARRFFEQHFLPYQLTDAAGAEQGLITGYYEPLLRGSRQRSPRYRYPVHGAPDDLLVIDLGEAYPELKGLGLRGRLDGRRVVPYYDRAQIERGEAPLAGKEIAWVDDAIELFFLHVQGSGRIALDTGETLRVGFADQNGRPYRSIGRVLVDRGELPLEKASMQGIKEWAKANPDRLSELLSQNGRYVFFRELPSGTSGPPGALGVPLTPQRSVAVDPRFVPLGAPVYIATTWPLTTRPLNRLMMAQDTGGAIRGAVRADFFWGYGEQAAREAGRMKQPLRMWVLLPRDYPLPR